MKKAVVLTLCFFLGLSGGLLAQGATPKNMIEIGLQGGGFIISGDLDPMPGYAGGLHFRKALDYVFSLRGDFLYGIGKGERMSSGALRTSETTWMGGSVLGVVSLNSLRWDKPVRSTNIYFMLGGGANYFSATYMTEFSRVEQTLDPTLSPHFTAGGGIAVRINNKINVGIETQAITLLGSRADLVDGINIDNDAGQASRSLFRDIPLFAGITVNYNLGNAGNATEPLYWINPLDNVMKDVKEIKDRGSDISLDDSDGDGVIDALDQEKNTPSGAIVDTKGRTLDSDRDGVPDHLDKEPFYTPRDNESVDSEGVVINPSRANSSGPGSYGSPGGGGVSEDRVRELIQEALQSNTPIADGSRTAAAEWFLPMIHFGVSSYTVKYSDYGNLASVARTLASNPDVRLAVIGFTDATGNEQVNNQLSYLRAQAVVDHLVNNHSIDRSRLVLMWKGSQESLVPSNSSFMNRRVELRVAGPGDAEMDPPSGDTTTNDDGY